MAIGLPCQPFAPGGGRLAEADPRAVESMESVPRAVTSLGNRYISVDIEECEFLQCTVLGKHGAVSDDATLRGRDVIFFLKASPYILSRCRYVPGMPRPGVSK